MSSISPKDHSAVDVTDTRNGHDIVLNHDIKKKGSYDVFASINIIQDKVMNVLLFLTDRFPYENSEAFIENEIKSLEDNFDKVVIYPLGLMADIHEKRKCGQMTNVMFPANVISRNYNDINKVEWSIKHMLGWCVLAIFSHYFYMETIELIKRRRISFSRILLLIRTEGINIRNTIHFYKRGMKLLNKEDKIYIYSYWMNSSILRIKNMLIKHNLNIKKVVMRAHRHDLYEEERKNKYIPYQKSLIEKVDSLVLISKDGYDYMCRTYPKYKEKYYLSYLGTKDYGMQNFLFKERSVLVSCSTLSPVKRVDMIARALSLIDDIEIEWLHFGTGKEQHHIIKLCEELLNNKNIRYKFMGYYPNEKLMDYYRHSNIKCFINVSESEGLPVSLMEAASFGIPLIATNVGGTSEILQDGYNGFLISKNFSVNALKDVILNFLTMDEEKYMEYRENSRRVWEKNFCADINYKKFVDNILKVK